MPNWISVALYTFIVKKLSFNQLFFAGLQKENWGSEERLHKATRRLSWRLIITGELRHADAALNFQLRSNFPFHLHILDCVGGFLCNWMEKWMSSQMKKFHFFSWNISSCYMCVHFIRKMRRMMKNDELWKLWRENRMKWMNVAWCVPFKHLKKLSSFSFSSDDSEFAVNQQKKKRLENFHFLISLPSSHSIYTSTHIIPRALGFSSFSSSRISFFQPAENSNFLIYLISGLSLDSAHFLSFLLRSKLRGVLGGSFLTRVSEWWDHRRKFHNGNFQKSHIFALFISYRSHLSL